MSQMSDTIRLPRQARSADPVDHRGLGGARAYHLAALLLCAGVLAASFVLQSETEGLSLFGRPWPLRCRLYETFGIRCALCGMSRAFCSLAQGDVQASLEYHPLGIAVFAVFCLEVLYRACRLLAGPVPRGTRAVKIHFGLVFTVCAAVFFHWLYYLGGLIT